MITTIIVVLTIYFVAMIAISWMGRKHATDFGSYLNVGRSAGVILCMGGAIGAHIGNGLVVGGAGEGASVGMSGVAYGVGCIISYIILALLANDMIYKGNYMSLADYFNERYKNELPAQIFNVTTVTSYVGMLGAQLMAGKVLFEALGMNGTIGLIAIAVVVFLYSQISGLWGAMATSVVQTVVIAIGVLAAVAYIFTTGGWDMVLQAVEAGTVPSSFMSLTKGYDLSTMLVLIIPTSLSIFTDQVTWQRINSAKSASVSKISLLLAVLVMLPCCLAPVIVGMYGHVAFGSTGNAAFFDVVLHTLPPVVAALIVAAVLAAVMSTIDGVLISFSTVILRGIYKKHINKTASDAKLSRMTLWVNIVVIAIGCFIALNAESIVNVLSNTYLFLCAACLIPYLGGWAWKKATTAGAVASSIVGAAIVIVQLLGIYTLPYSSITLFIPSLIVFIVVSLMTQENKAAIC